MLLVVRPGAPGGVLAPSSKARSYVRSFLLLVVRPGAPSSVLAPSSKARSYVRSFLLLVALGSSMPLASTSPLFHTTGFC